MTQIVDPNSPQVNPDRHAHFETLCERNASIPTLDRSAVDYRSLIEQIATIVWEINAVGDTGELSGWKAFTGQSDDLIAAEGWLEAVHPEDRDLTAQAWNLAVKRCSIYQVEYRLRHHSGEYRWMAVHGVPVVNPDGTIAQWFGFHIDINDRKIAQLAAQGRAQELALNLLLAQMMALAEQHHRELDQFTYTIAHDLKAPLRAVANLSQWIEDDLTGQVSVQNEQQLQLLRSRVSRMQTMLDGLLEYARLGHTEVSLETVVVADLVAQIVEVLAPPANFTITIATDLPTIQTKRKLLAQVFSHLIDNAIKHHHPPGEMPIGAALANRSVANIHITGQTIAEGYEFGVTDDGQGIPPDRHEFIFGIFQTLGTKTDSTGMGLPIVKKIVESEGKDIRLSSTMGEGTSFHFTWSAAETVDS